MHILADFDVFRESRDKRKLIFFKISVGEMSTSSFNVCVNKKRLDFRLSVYMLLFQLLLYLIQGA